MKNKNYYLLLIVCLQVCAAFGQKNSDMIRRIDANYKDIPMQSFKVSECECTNEDYLTFLNAQAGAKKQFNYDSLGWNMTTFFPYMTARNEPIISVYYWHPKYKTYPIVNISQESAMAYCKWLTDVYNASPTRKYKKVEFRLPNENDWKLAAIGIIPGKQEKRLLPWSGLIFRDPKGNYLANYAPNFDSNLKRDANGEIVFSNNNGPNYGADGHIYTAACKEGNYPPNDFGLYHMAGNVSEYTSKIGQAKGGGFMSPGYYLLIDTNEPEFSNLQNGAAFVGFRPFMYVIDEK